MSITLSPAKAAYLTRVTQGLADLPAEEREEMVQDLEAHLSELEDEEVESTLGTPEAFVEEFRQSAGLGYPSQVSRSRRARAREDLNLLAARLSQVTHWQTIRPMWVWTRGWLLVCAWSFLYDYEGFSRFPIPSVAQSSGYGLVLVAAATTLSVWLDDAPPGRRWRPIGSAVFSAISGLALIGMLLNPMPTLSEVAQQYENQAYTGQLTGPDGNAITNIHAFDLEGNPVDVLLFDQDGRPLMTLPSYVYEEDYGIAQEPYYYGDGTVIFQRDQYGRIIPNLYPLELTGYDEHGNLQPVPPPSLGFPSQEEDGAVDDGEAVPTTILGNVR
jgi:hypothetical protein